MSETQSGAWLRRARTAAAALGAGALAACAATPSPLQRDLEAKVDRFVEDNENVPGVAVAIVGPAESAAAAAGTADEAGRPMTAETPLRIASNTKTYVAAAILRLWEDGKIDLDAPIADLIDPQYSALLESDGYDTRAITVRHLLMHVSGMPDHADEQYVALVMEDPQHQWTRAEQVALLVKNHDPLGPPKSEFQYSDTGYVLLGDIIERATGETLAAAVRALLAFDRIGLDATWWEQAEPRPATASARAVQFIGGQDTYDWNPSMDLYGGGGLVASVEDLATFWAALMRGEIFRNGETLDVMLNAPGNPFPDQYRIGVFPRVIDGVQIYFHSGFWGTFALYAPADDLAIAGAVTDQSGYRNLSAMLLELVTARGESNRQ